MQERESVQLCGTPVSDDASLIRTRHRQKWYMGIRKQWLSCLECQWASSRWNIEEMFLKSLEA